MVLKMKMTVGEIMLHLSIIGEIISGSEEEDDEEAETNEEDAEAYMQEQQAKLEDEKNAILNNQNMLQSVSIVTLAPRL